ncbi:MAG TPA: sigma factor, partial [Tepidisphaeraceae bacterium]
MPEPALLTNSLQEYISTGSPDAFRQIVEAHIDAVYSQCRRQLRDADRAEEATQVVFVTLARRARELRPGVLLGGWLFNTARYVCARERRTERRRIARERKAAAMRHETIA